MGETYLYGSGVSVLMKVEERWWENGEPPGRAGFSGQLGLTQSAQRAGKMGRGIEAYLNGLGFSGLMKEREKWHDNKGLADY